MNELLTWLRAQLDVDERVAKGLNELESSERNGIESAAGRHAVAFLDHFSRNRQLTEVDVRRQVLNLHGNSYATLRSRKCHWCQDSAPCLDLRLQALPYADRPGYRPEWKP